MDLGDEDESNRVAEDSAIAVRLAALDRLAVFVEAHPTSLGEESICAFCSARFTVMPDRTCPQCGAPMH